MKESKLQRDIRKALEKEIGGFWFKTHGSQFQMKGLPDLLGCVDGRYIGIEVKKYSSGTTKPHQISVLKRMRTAGAIAFVTRSSEHAVRKLRNKLLKKQTVPLPTKGNQIRVSARSRRPVYGDGNWQDNLRNRLSSKKIQKRPKRT